MTFALFAAAPAILVIGLEVDALAAAARFPRRAIHAALPVAAGRRASTRRLACRLAVSAMINVRVRVHAGGSAGNVRRLAVELTLAGLTGGRGVGGGHAYLAAGAAVGGIARGVHASGATGGLAATGERTASAFAHLIRPTSVAAGATVLGIRALVDASVRTVGIATVAVDRALSTAADRNAIGRRATNFATSTAIVAIGVEILATGIAGAVACRADQPTNRVLTNSAGVWRATAHFGAITAMAGIVCQVHARTAAILGPRWARRGALAARTHLVLLALSAAGAAVAGI